MIKQLTAATLGLAAILAANPAGADYLVYTDRASFDAAIIGEHTETFNELGSSLQSYGAAGLSMSGGLIQPLSITGSSNFLLSGSASALANFYPANGTYLVGPTSTNSTDGINVILPSKTYAAGADVGVFTSKSIVSFLVTTTNGINATSFTSSVAVDASQPGSSLGFLGVIDTTPGDSVVSLNFSAPILSNKNVVIDNVSFGFAPVSVPEPASMVSLIAGSLVIAASAIRRKLRRKAA